MKGFFSVFTFIFFSIISVSQNYDSLISYYKLRADKYMVKDSSVYNFFEIDEGGIRIFSSPKTKELDSAEFFLKWKDLAVFKHMIHETDLNTQLLYYSKKNMKGYKIPSKMNTIYYNGKNDKPLLGK